MLPALAAMSTGVVDRFNWESNFCTRLASWCEGGAVMVADLGWAGGGRGAKDGVLVAIPAARADSISLRCCSKSAVYFLFCIEILFLLTEIHSKFLCGSRLSRGHSCLPSHIGMMGAFTWVGCNSFQVVIPPFHPLCKWCLGIFIQFYGSSRSINIDLLIVR